MEKLKKFYLTWKHAIPLILYGILYLTWFCWLEENVTKGYTVIHVALDNYIPFVEVFVVPYFLWFAYVAAVVIFFFLRGGKGEKSDFYKTCIFLFTGMTVFLIISTLWPNGHHLRPYHMPRNNIFTQWISFLYQTDTATNLWPSIHVYNSLGAHLAISKSSYFADKKGIKIASLFLAVSIVLSTVLIKQHSAFDVVTAFIMAAVMYVLVYRPDILTALRTRLEKKIKPQIG